MVIDWNNLGKIRIANPNPSFEKHEIVKLLLTMKILYRNRSIKSYIHIYTEFVVKDGRKCDIFYENLKSKSGYIFEIQKEDNKEWEKEIVNFYKDFNVSYLNSTDLIIIKLKDLSDDITKLSEELDEYV